MEMCGYVWTFIDIYGHLLIFMDMCGDIYGPNVYGYINDIYGHLWTFMDIYGYL